MIHLILLSGGSGTRLWPLSNSARSKQFLKVLRDADGRHVSMVQRVFGQIGAVGADVSVTIATSANQEPSIRSQLKGPYELVLEPERRDTAPAIMLACAHLDLVQGADSSDTVIVMPIDTFADQGYYDRIPNVDEAVQSGVADLVLIGAAPAYPSEKYGYIIPAKGDGKVLRVSEFKEKPTEAEAKRLIEQGGLWNCGVFGFKLGYLRDLTRPYLDLHSFDAMVASYGELPKVSFDYEVVERAESVAVVPYSGTWKDLGTWNTLTEEMAESVSGRVAVDAETCSDVHVINETNLPVVVAGLRDAVVATTRDGVLVTSKEASSSSVIKDLIAQVAEQRPMHERRRWGEYSVLGTGEIGDDKSVLVKAISIAPGGQFSYQRHLHRSEVWVVVSGEGEAVVDSRVTALSAGSVVNIPVGSMHACHASDGLLLIEIQVGGPLVEDDIERFGAWWD